MNSRRRLVHMIHINPRRVVFESSHEVFVVPLHDQGGLVAGDATSSLPESVPTLLMPMQDIYIFLLPGTSKSEEWWKMLY